MTSILAYDAHNLPPLDILCCYGTPRNTLWVVWDLSALYSTVLSRLPDSTARDLSISPHRAKWGNYKFFYIPGKLFSIQKHDISTTFYDLSQYFPSSPEPSTLSDLQSKADELQSALADLGIPSPMTLASPISIAGGPKLLDRYHSTIPTIIDAPESVLDAYDIALQCTPREWVSNYRIGHFPELYTVDIASAYPYQASSLIDLRDCSFHQSADLDQSAYYGFLVGDFTVYPNHPLAFCSPFLADRGDGTLVNFVGTVPNYPCLIDEVRTLYRYNLGEFRIKSGWYISPISGVRPRLPFQPMMADLYSRRSGSSDLASYILKRIMNGLIGKLLETRKDKDGNLTGYGGLYNPIYHALCTTRTRLQVFDFLIQNEITRDELVHIGVDGVKTTRYIALPKQSAMGKWRCSDSTPTFILSPATIITPERSFKESSYSSLLESAVTHPSSSKFGDIDLRKLFMNQNRHFSKLPRVGSDLLSNRYTSDPVIIQNTR